MDNPHDFEHLELHETRHIGLPLLKKINREKLQHLYFTVSEQERLQKYDLKNKSYSQNRPRAFWEWQADDGSWHIFCPEEQARLEYASETNQATVPFLDSLHFMHTVDLIRMERVNMKTGIGKKIRRTPPVSPLANANARTEGCKEGSSIHPYCHANYRESEEHFDGIGDSSMFSRRGEFNGHLAELSDDDGIDVLGTSSLQRMFQAPRATTLPSLTDIPGQRNQLFQSSTSEGITRSRYSQEVKKPSSKHQLKTTKKPSHARKPPHKNTCDQDDVQKLHKWLKSIKLGEHLEQFRKERITLKEIVLLNEEDLKNLGLPMGARKRMLEGLKDLKANKEPPNEFLCPITTALMKDPMILCDGFSYEKSAIERWLTDHNKSPMTNEALDSKVLTPNRQLKKLIDDYKSGQLDI